MTKNSKKLQIGLVAGLSAIALIGTGFAAWSIEYLDTKQEGDGNVSAETDISVRYVYVNSSSAWTSGGSEIRFASPSNQDSSANLTGSDKNENLTVTYSLVLDHSMPTSPTVTAELTETDAAKAYTAAYNSGNGIVGALPKEGASGDGQGVITVTSSGPTGSDNAYQTTYAVQVDFKWGSAVNYQNPYTYLNAETDKNASWVSVAQSTLSLLSALSGSTFKLTMNIAAPAAQ